MITLEDIAPIGTFGKAHGIKGEINADFNADYKIDECPCFIVDIDGIFVPFFIDEYRFKSESAGLFSFEGINTEEDVRIFTGKTIYINKEYLENNDNDEMSLCHYVGFTLISRQGISIGQIISIDDSTANILFELSNGSLIPVAALEIIDVKPETHAIVADIPDGLLDLQ